MDFSFIDSEPSGHPTGQQPPARPGLQLPTWHEVQAAKQPSAPTILFRPTGLLAAARQNQQHQPDASPGGVIGPQAAATIAVNPCQPPPGGASPYRPAPPSSSGCPQGPSPCWDVHAPGIPPSMRSETGNPGAGGGTGGLGPGPSHSHSAGAAGGFRANEAAPNWNNSCTGGGAGSGILGRPPSGSIALAGQYYGAPRPAGGYVVQQPTASPAPPPNAMLVNRRQQGNLVLKHIRNVRWQFADIVPDYQLGQGTAALFLSLRYHLLHPDYILHRIREQQRLFRLTVLLVHVDLDDVVKPLGEVSRAAVVGDCTLVCGWSPEECARWLETYKSYESKPASSIQERVDPDYVSRLAAVLAGSVRGVNRTDAHTLGTSFGSLAAMLRCNDPDAFSACPGIGPTKVRRLMEAFHEPFRKQLKMTRVGEAAAAAGSAAGTEAQRGVRDPTLMPATATAAAVATAAAATAAGSAAAASALPARAPPKPAGAAAAAAGASVVIGVPPPPGQGDRIASGDTEGGQAGRSGGRGMAAVERERKAEVGDPRVDGEAAGSQDVWAEAAEMEGEQDQPEQLQQQHGRTASASAEGSEDRRQQLLELLMSQMPAGDDDVSDGDEDYRL